jgi:hypothetical protein
LAQSPVSVCGSITIPSGVTLTIEPGVIVKLDAGVGITVANGGRLLAEGNETNRIQFTAAGASRWGGFVINGAVGSPETRITYADIEGNGTTGIESASGTVFLDNLNFLTTDHQYVSLDSSSFIVSHCHFPSCTTQFEPGHGTGGIKAGGHGIFRRNYFGGDIGYSDVVDFTGGQRPQPIVHFINNVIESGSDDGWDLDGTDAWVEGNIFLHQHRNGNTPDSSASVSGGNDSGQTSEITIVGNLFFDDDNAATAKQGNFFAVVNNTIVHMTNQGGIDGDTGALVVQDTTPSATTYARGMYVEGNIVYDVKQLVRNYNAAQTVVTWVNNLIPMAWTGPGTSNEVVADPLLQHIPTVTEARFTNWASAQIVRQWFSLQTNSPAIGTGPDGRDKGGVIPIGVVLSGVPTGATTNTDATLIVGGFHRTGFDMPTANGWPQGMGYTHYKYRLDGGAWSAETPIATPITLTNLADGDHYVEVSGKRDSGLYQDDPLFGEDAVVTRSATWTVQSAAAPLQIGDVAPQQDGSVSLTFNAEAGKSYSLLERDGFDAQHPWSKVASTPTETTSGPVTLSDPNSAAGNVRFYEIVTPAVP